MPDFEPEFVNSEVIIDIDGPNPGSAAPAQLDKDLMSLLAATGRKYTDGLIQTGGVNLAGDDIQKLQNITDNGAMLLVKSEGTHTIKERTDPADLCAGAKTLLDTVTQLLNAEDLDQLLSE